MPVAEQVLSRMVEALAPEDAPVYFALFVDLEATAELDVPGYERVAYLEGWLGAEGTRVNGGGVEWGVLEAGAIVRAVGVFDAAEGGLLLAWSRTLTMQGAETEVVIEAGDFCALPPGAVRFSVFG